MYTTGLGRCSENGHAISKIKSCWAHMVIFKGVLREKRVRGDGGGVCAGFSEHPHLNNHFVLSPSIAVMLGIPATNYLLGIKIESFTTLEMSFI